MDQKLKIMSLSRFQYKLLHENVEAFVDIDSIENTNDEMTDKEIYDLVSGNNNDPKTQIK